MAAFLESSDSFGIYRKFGHSHARLLIDHESSLTKIEEELLELDKIDEAGDEATAWRLKNRKYKQGPDTRKRDLQEKLEKELLVYGMTFPMLNYKERNMCLPSSYVVPLLLNYQRLKSLDQTPPRDHDSVFKWLWKWKPLDSPEFAWINHPEDFVSLVPPRRNGFENFILRHLDKCPRSALRVLILIPYKSINTH